MLLVVAVVAGLLWAFPDAVSRLRQATGPHAAASTACLLEEGPCTATFADGTAVTLDITPRGLPTETPLTLAVSVEGEGVPDHVEIQGIDMNMGLITTPLKARPDGSYAGTAIIPVCTTDQMQWHADVVLDGRTAGFGFDVTKDSNPLPEAVYGDFTLESAEGPLSLSDLRGKVVVVYFGYTSCPDICPTTLQTLAGALGKLEPEQAEQVVGLMVSLDPERDSPQHLAEYTSWFHPSIRGATGTPEAVAEVAGRWGVTWRRVEDEGSALGYTLDHDTRAFLVAPDGHMVGFIRHGTSSDAVARQIATLL